MDCGNGVNDVTSRVQLVKGEGNAVLDVPHLIGKQYQEIQFQGMIRRVLASAAGVALELLR
jgi:hypothetical protein